MNRPQRSCVRRFFWSAVKGFRSGVTVTVSISSSSRSRALFSSSSFSTSLNWMQYSPEISNINNLARKLTVSRNFFCSSSMHSTNDSPNKRSRCRCSVPSPMDSPSFPFFGCSFSKTLVNLLPTGVSWL
eukprot:Lithocolla_globosa_v1_NODE_717_length_3393_cov_20.802454.p5 type:complete len:129 gc:universal NODE_717_length_3393_cov_20.802454:2965-2579(-)